VDLKEIWSYVPAGCKWLNVGPVTCFCEHTDEPLGFINTEENRDWLSSCHLLKNDFGVWSNIIS